VVLLKMALHALVAAVFVLFLMSITAGVVYAEEFFGPFVSANPIVAVAKFVLKVPLLLAILALVVAELREIVERLVSDVKEILSLIRRDWPV
jgi:hypothetical protein